MRRLGVLVALLSGCELAVSTSGLEGGCPPREGPSLVQVNTTSGSYCIDATEVTSAQYTRFIAVGSMPATPPAGCEQATDPTPIDHWPPPPGYGQFPVAEVTWCQAYAYCAWAGKRLCGEIGGGALAEINGTNASLSQWLYACTDGGAHAYPYGDTFDPNACGGQAAQSTIAEVGSHAGCVGGLPGIHDLSGNVWEWTDTCHDETPGAFCHVLGGAFDSTQGDLACAGERNWVRTSAAANIGFRCCRDL
jgi:formylglycine-generating enzyme required for sulfatase activity